MTITEQETVKASKFLSLVLRHQPSMIGIHLDTQGWTDVEVLIKKAQSNGFPLDHALLSHVVETNPKKRFTFNETGNRIRASQGHSVEIELGYKSQTPPKVLYHGTTGAHLDSILKTGIEKRTRHHVHLSVDVEAALKVGQRHGKPVILEVQSGQMHIDGIVFFLSENSVWLTEYVDSKYLILSH